VKVRASRAILSSRDVWRHAPRARSTGVAMESSKSLFRIMSDVSYSNAKLQQILRITMIYVK